MFFRKTWPAIAWAILILVLTGLPGNYVPAIGGFWDWLGVDKVVHLILFGTLASLLMHGLRTQYSFPRLRSHSILYMLIPGIIFAGLTEILQRHVFIGRSGNGFDFLADIAGLVAGLALYMIFFKKRERFKENI